MFTLSCGCFRLPAECLTMVEQEEETSQDQRVAAEIYDAATPISQVDPQLTFDLRDKLGIEVNVSSS